MPQPGDQVVISAGTIVILDPGASWMQTFQSIVVSGTLHPRITVNSALPVTLLANTRIEITADGRILGYDLDHVNSNNPRITGISVPIELTAPMVSNFGAITGGSNFRAYWGNAEVNAAPSFIWIGPMSAGGMGPQTLVFRNTGTVSAGSGVAGLAPLACPGGTVTILARDSIFNNAGGIIESGGGYVSVPPPYPNAAALGGDVIIGWAGNDQEWWWDGWQWETGTHVIDGDGGIIRGGLDQAPGESYSGTLWVEVGDGPTDYLSLSAPGTRVQQFGNIVLRSWRTAAGAGIRLSDLDELAIRARRNWLGAPTSGPANGGGLWIDYLENNQVDLRLNPAETVVLAAETEDFGGYEAGVHFSHFAESADVLLDPGVTLETICDPDPTFFDSRNVPGYSTGRLSPGWGTPVPGIDFFLPSLGLPGDTAYVFLRFRKFGAQHTYRIDIQDTRSYTFWPQTVWINPNHRPDTTFTVRFLIPQIDTAGTQNPLLITSATYPEGELADTMRGAVVVVPPVKVLAEKGLGTAPGFTDTITVSVHNYLNSGQTFNINSFSEGWSLTPGMRSPWIPANSTITMEFYVQIPPGATPGQTNWAAFRASVSGGRNDFWDRDTTVVTAATLAAPEGLVIRASGNDVLLNWRSADEAARYQVLYSSNGLAGPWTALPATTDTFYVHSGVIPGYDKTFYMVKALQP